MKTRKLSNRSVFCRRGGCVVVSEKAPFHHDSCPDLLLNWCTNMFKVFRNFSSVVVHLGCVQGYIDVESSVSDEMLSRGSTLLSFIGPEPTRAYSAITK